MRVELYVTAGPAKGRHFTFDKPDSFLFGRAPDAHISLPQDRYVSRQHFLLDISPPHCKLKDLNSKNGVIVNGVLYGGKAKPDSGVQQAPQQRKDVALHHGDEIVVGDTHIRVIVRMTDVSPPVAPDEPASSSSPAGRGPQPWQTLQTLLKSAEDQAAYVPFDSAHPGDITIPGYQLEGRIKHAGSGMLYLGTQLASGIPVSIKLLSPRHDLDPYMKRAFHRELTIIRQLNHPNLVRLLDHGEVAGFLFLVFEPVQTCDLAHYLHAHGGKVPLQEAAPIWMGILNGLAYVHRVRLAIKNSQGQRQSVRGIVHRNLKPQNIVLAEQPDGWLPKIADFGLAKTFEAAGGTDITTSGDVLGTPVYWPREQVTHYRYLNPASDVFAIAAIFYEMLTGSWVRDGFEALFATCKQRGRRPSIADYMILIANHPPIPIREKAPELPEPVARVLDRALQEEEVPHDTHQMRARLQALRYADAGEFREALVRAFQDAGLPVPAASAGPPAAAPQPAEMPQPPQTIMYSVMHAPTKQEVALFLLDIVGSTQFLLKKGDTDFSTMMGALFRRIRKHASAGDLILLKSTGDGFLAVYQSAEAALSVARTYLEQPPARNIHLRMALHWGTVNTGPDGDVLGTEVRRVFRVENVEQRQCVAPSPEGMANFSAIDRILATQAFWDQLPRGEQAHFQRAGTFVLNREQARSCDLWLWHAR